MNIIGLTATDKFALMLLGFLGVCALWVLGTALLDRAIAWYVTRRGRGEDDAS